MVARAGAWMAVARVGLLRDWVLRKHPLRFIRFGNREWI